MKNTTIAFAFGALLLGLSVPTAFAYSSDDKVDTDADFALLAPSTSTTFSPAPRDLAPESSTTGDFVVPETTTTHQPEPVTTTTIPPPVEAPQAPVEPEIPVENVTPPTAVEVPETPEVPEDQELLEDTNEARGGGLKWSDELASYAQAHVAFMQANGLQHSNLARVLPLGWSIAGENVGVGPTVDSIQMAYLNSQTHAENILDPRFTHYGSFTGLSACPGNTVEACYWTTSVYAAR